GRSALRTKGYAIVTEGYMDVVALAQWGFGNAVATLGTACSGEHVQKLLRFTEQIVFSFDGDAAGRRAAGRALEAALPFATDTRRISFLFLPSEHDPDSYIREFGPEAFEDILKQAIPLSRQLIEHAAADCELDSAEGRARLLAQALPLLACLPEGALRGQIADDLAAQARANPDEVRQRLAQALAGKARSRESLPPASQAAQNTGAPWDGSSPPPADYEAHDAYSGYEASQGNRSHDSGYPNAGAGNGAPGNHGGERPRWKKNQRPWDGPNRWQRQGRPADRRPPPQAARPLERIVWLLAARSELWEQLPAHCHELLCEQAGVFGDFFRWLDRLLLQEGPLAADALHEQMRQALPEDGQDLPFTHLLKRIEDFHDVLSGEENLDELLGLVKPLQLQAINEELELL